MKKPRVAPDSGGWRQPKEGRIACLLSGIEFEGAKTMFNGVCGGYGALQIVLTNKVTLY